MLFLYQDTYHDTCIIDTPQHCNPGPIECTNASAAFAVVLFCFSSLMSHQEQKSKFRLFHVRSSGLPSRILTCTELQGHWLCLF